MEAKPLLVSLCKFFAHKKYLRKIFISKVKRTDYTKPKDFSIKHDIEGFIICHHIALHSPSLILYIHFPSFNTHNYWPPYLLWTVSVLKFTLSLIEPVSSTVLRRTLEASFNSWFRPHNVALCGWARNSSAHYESCLSWTQSGLCVLRIRITLAGGRLILSYWITVFVQTGI